MTGIHGIKACVQEINKNTLGTPLLDSVKQNFLTKHIEPHESNFFSI